MKKLRRTFLCMMFSCYAAAGVLSFFGPMTKAPIPYCEENPCKDVRTEN